MSNIFLKIWAALEIMVIKAQNRETDEVSGDHSIFSCFRSKQAFYPQQRVLKNPQSVLPLVCTAKFHTHTKHYTFYALIFTLKLLQIHLIGFVVVINKIIFLTFLTVYSNNEYRVFGWQGVTTYIRPDMPTPPNIWQSCLFCWEIMLSS